MHTIHCGRKAAALFPMNMHRGDDWLLQPQRLQMPDGNHPYKDSHLFPRFHVQNSCPQRTTQLQYTCVIEDISPTKMLREINRPLAPFTPPVQAPRSLTAAGEGRRLIARKYRKAQLKKIQRREYLKLRAIVPSVAAKERVSKVTVIEEAIKYIDELHQALSERLQGSASDSSGSESYSSDVSSSMSPQSPVNTSSRMACIPDNPSTPLMAHAPCSSPGDQSPLFSLLSRLS
ncbi:hypothetical protein CAPTEDRAFT_225014 [Capitella teleta]|uniref:BHLH domain-containing protein n=1 Tax=Capitella teleta TaxID=283909 RepID=R7V044_CAPTE|nr:hypothetical protein CAPTEDRAFT_225014 [Capitella teleta]|eukprot:ELU12193.1 hypothetical protein CAPTEDRAFT_225014 [Capitella teleta]